MEALLCGGRSFTDGGALSPMGSALSQMTCKFANDRSLLTVEQALVNLKGQSRGKRTLKEHSMGSTASGFPLICGLNLFGNTH